MLLRGLAAPETARLLSALESVTERAPFRCMTTPNGLRMSVAMTNCGSAGWVSGPNGYRYAHVDPHSGLAWLPMPQVYLDLAATAAAAAGFGGFTPDACLINRYAPGTRLSLHQDKDERDFSAPIVSVSLACRLSFCSVAPAVASAHTAYRLHTATSSSGVVSRACAITVCCP